MDANHIPSPDVSSTDAASPLHPGEAPAAEQRKRIGAIDGHLPDIVDPLVPPHPDTAFEQTRRLRHDGWTSERKQRFLELFAECGVIADACRAVGMSARSVTNLRARDPLFAAGLDAAMIMARPRLADEAYARSINGVLERVYRDGAIVAERHRYDNRLTMSVLRRLDARADRAEERGDPALNLVARWDDYLAAVGADRREDALALLAPPPPPAPDEASAAEGHGQAGEAEVQELCPGSSASDRDEHRGVWEEVESGWWTDYPPPSDFDGEEEGEYGDLDYCRTLSPAEQTALDAMLAEEDAEEQAAMAEDCARAEAQRRAFFFGAEPQEKEEEGKAGA